MLTNTTTRYGAIARFFHWSIALLVLADIALGLVGKFTPRSGDTVGFLQLLYSTHKTIGVTVLALAVFRVVWAVTQPRPVPLHPERRLENFAAETAHWVLYAAIFVLPLTGWVMHSAEVGFAPIWWPFGQDLPFVPKSESIAHTAANLHWAAGIVLALTVAAHIGGALKHVVIDRDGTLVRMLRGDEVGNPETRHGGKTASALAALVVWGVALGGAATVFAPSSEHRETAAQSSPSVASGWVVQDGTLAISVLQIGAEVTGSFARWQAEIDYEAQTGVGTVTAVIDTTSLTLGSVTDQAKGPEFFNVATHSQAIFTGAIAQTDGTAHTATGTLTLVGQAVPVKLEFDLQVTDGTAKMTGSTVLDRRDFGMGAAYPDESSVGFSVDVTIELTAKLSE